MQRQFDTFIFDGYTFNKSSGELSLKYSIDHKLELIEILRFDVSSINWDLVDETALDQACACLHLAGGISYYKSFCPPHIIVKSQSLNLKQADFWNIFYTKGLAEFFFSNQIDSQGLIAFPVNSQSSSSRVCLQLPERSLVPIGGGKDSIVTAESMLLAELDFSCFSLNQAKPIKDTIDLIGKPAITVNRQLDPLLFQLNQQGALNGHVPITGYLSCVAVLAALLHGYKYIVMSLEKSADYPQVISADQQVNHQYSKSREFEDNLSKYLADFVCADLHYFSILRPFYELHIAKLFSEICRDKPEYLGVFTSCNSNFRQQDGQRLSSWCGRCPKCAFVFTILSPFLAADKLIATFKKNLFQDHSLVGLYRSLLGLTEQLPFECVGTAQETQVALWMACNKKEFSSTPVVEMFRHEVLPQMDNPAQAAENLLMRAESCRLPAAFKGLLHD